MKFSQWVFPTVKFLTPLALVFFGQVLGQKYLAYDQQRKISLSALKNLFSMDRKFEIQEVLLYVHLLFLQIFLSILVIGQEKSSFSFERFVEKNVLSFILLFLLVSILVEGLGFFFSAARNCSIEYLGERIAQLVLVIIGLIPFVIFKEDLGIVSITDRQFSDGVLFFENYNFLTYFPSYFLTTLGLAHMSNSVGQGPRFYNEQEELAQNLLMNFQCVAYSFFVTLLFLGGHNRIWPLNRYASSSEFEIIVLDYICFFIKVYGSFFAFRILSSFLKFKSVRAMSKLYSYLVIMCFVSSVVVGLRKYGF